MEPKDITGTVSKAGTFDLVAEEISKLSSSSPDGFTVSEMVSATGHCENWCRSKLKALIVSGRAVCAGRRSMTMMDGRSGKYSPVYRLVENG